jgi:hypothetical protein
MVLVEPSLVLEETAGLGVLGRETGAVVVVVVVPSGPPPGTVVVVVVVGDVTPQMLGAACTTSAMETQTCSPDGKAAAVTM